MKRKYPPVGGSRKWAIWKFGDITRPDSDDVYLRRLRVVQTPLFGLYVHWIYRPDADDHPHDHPWTFWRYIWRGWYVEEVFRKRGDFADLVQDYHMASQYTDRLTKFSYHKAHRILKVSERPIVSIVLVGRRRQESRFYPETGAVDWREYEGSKDS